MQAKNYQSLKVKFLEKEINGIKVPDVTELKTDIATIKAEISSLEKKIAESNKNPLSG